MCLWSWFFFFWIAKKMQMDGVTVATDKMLLKHFTGMKPWPEEKRRSCESTDEEDSRREKCSFNTEMDQFCLNAGDSPGQVSLMRRFEKRSGSGSGNAVSAPSDRRARLSPKIIVHLWRFTVRGPAQRRAGQLRAAVNLKGQMDASTCK